MAAPGPSRRRAGAEPRRDAGTLRPGSFPSRRPRPSPFEPADPFGPDDPFDLADSFPGPRSERPHRADTLTEPRPGGPAPPDGEDVDWKGDGRPEKERKGPLAFLRELPVLILVAFLLALLIKTFLVQAFYIPSESMLPTLEVGDRVLVNKVVYRLHPPRRGDIIVFAEPHPPPGQERSWWQSFTHWLTEGLGMTADPTKDYIKRVIALPGETVEVRKGTVYVDGKRLDESYVSELEDASSFPPHEVPEDSLFVMGDNRPNSQDSRSILGDIPMDKVIGKAFIVIWPPSEFRWLSGS